MTSSSRVAPAALPRGAAADSAPAAERFVPEIAGLRTIALLLVATFHIWFGKVSGGVDIFLLIGAYLMTRSLTARAEAGGFTRPLSFILRKFARLMPAAITTIVLTVIAALLLTPARSWETLFDQAFASGAYWMNFWLQGEAVNYFATDRHESSFFQHFWSLSLQGQVFIIWPLVHLIGEGIARLTRIRPRMLLLGIFSAGAIVSFVVALVTVADNPDLAYFDLPSRLWEFALGSVLALVAPWLSIPTLLRRIMTSVGLIGAILCGVVMPIDAQYPGWPALWPIMCAVLVIAAADSPPREGAGPDAILGSRILQRIGGYTYALYLTHWPVLILFANLTGESVPSPLGGFGLLAIAAVVAVLITRLVERPLAAWVRGEAPWSKLAGLRVGTRTVAVVLCGVLVAVGTAFFGNQAFAAASANAEDEVWTTDVSNRGPQAGPADSFDSLVPSDIVINDPADAPGDWCPRDEWFAGLCVESGAASPERSIVVIGNSHAMAYTGIFWETVQQNPTWHLRSYGAPGCIFPGAGAEGVVDGTASADCVEIWNTGLDYVLETQPDLLVVMGSVSRVDAPEALHDGTPAPDLDNTPGDVRPLIEQVRAQTATEVVVARDVPRLPTEPYLCGAEQGFESPECVFPVVDDPETLGGFIDSVEQAGGVWVDFQGVVCPGRECRPTMGGLVTYLDDNHITGVFSRSLAQSFADQVGDRISWWPTQVWPDA